MIEIRTIFDILWKGFIIGVVVSAPLGPVGVLCIQRTLNKGRWYGFITGLGASLSDIAYALLTGYGMSFVFDYVNKNIFYLQLLGSIMLLAFGVYTFRSNHPSCLYQQRFLFSQLHYGVRRHAFQSAHHLPVYRAFCTFCVCQRGSVGVRGGHRIHGNCFRSLVVVVRHYLFCE